MNNTLPQPTLVRFDWAIKYLLRNKKNFDILEGFLSELLHQDITILNILESESNQESASDKYNRVDLLVETLTKEKIIIEVQCSRQYDYLNRILYGTSKIITESINRGEPYSEISKVISVSILYFDLGQGDDYIYLGNTQFKGLHTHNLLGLSQEEQDAYKIQIQTPADIFPEYYLIKVNQFDQRIKDNMDEWIYLLKNAAVKQSFKAKGIQAAGEKLHLMKLNDQDRQVYNTYMKDLHQEASMVQSTYGKGKREGRIEGRMEAKLETARNMQAKGMDLELITELTGLTLAQLEQMR